MPSEVPSSSVVQEAEWVGLVVNDVLGVQQVRIRGHVCRFDEPAIGRCLDRREPRPRILAAGTGYRRPGNVDAVILEGRPPAPEITIQFTRSAADLEQRAAASETFKTLVQQPDIVE